MSTTTQRAPPLGTRPKPSSFDMASSTWKLESGSTTPDIDDVTDIFASSLETLFSETTVALGDPHRCVKRHGVTVYPPTTLASNWNLQVDAVWRAALYLADNLPDVQGKHVLELGAGSGLPGILLARSGHPLSVTLSDYPDPHVLETLCNNVRRNSAGDGDVAVEVVGHAWGSSSTLWPLAGGQFDMVIGADILWLPEQHENLCTTLDRVLRRSKGARVHLVAGFHTGRWTISKFLERAGKMGIIIDRIREVPASEKHEAEAREWDTDRVETELEKRHWFVEITLKWSTESLKVEIQGAAEDSIQSLEHFR